jgi:Tfp pilus assembly protein PilX
VTCSHLSDSRDDRQHRPGGSERGVALVIALLAMMLRTALGMALMLTSQTETLIGGNFRDSVEGSYVADAGIERVMQDVLTVPDWNTILTSPDGIRAGVTSGFVDGTLTPTMPDGKQINLVSATNMINCNKVTTCSDADLNALEGDRLWGPNNPRYRLFAWGPVNDLNPTATLNSPFYLVVWIADDSAETDSDPNVDGGAQVAPFTSAPRRSVPAARTASSRPRWRAPTAPSSSAATPASAGRTSRTAARARRRWARRAPASAARRCRLGAG